MINYYKINTLKPEDIENKKTYLIGGGIASLSTAAYLILDGHMDGKNITIFEDGNANDGYIIRGGRKMEAHYKCC